MRKDTSSFTPGSDGLFGKDSGGLVVATLKAISAACRESVVRRVMAGCSSTPAGAARLRGHPQNRSVPHCTQDVQEAEYRLWGWRVLVWRAGLRGWIAGAGLLLAACNHDPYVNVIPANTISSGEWRIERQIDRVTGAPISSAILTTNHVSNSGIVVAPPAQMQLACFKEHPVVVFVFAFKIGSTRNAELGYRFDEKPGHEPRVRVVEDYKRAVIEDRNEVAQFAGELATAGGLYVRIRSLNAGRTSAEFKVAGAPAAIAAAYAGCPLAAAARASALPPSVRDDKDDTKDKDD